MNSQPSSRVPVLPHATHVTVLQLWFQSAFWTRQQLRSRSLLLRGTDIAAFPRTDVAWETSHIGICSEATHVQMSHKAGSILQTEKGRQT
jgi:hypothetical protein